MTAPALDVDLSGRVAVVTGANSGMGKETARELARLGADVILGCRNRQRGEAAREDIAAGTGAAAVTVMEIDLSSLASVGAFVSEFRERFASLDVLVNNAAASLPAREATPEGFERQWATNVLGPYVLTIKLIPVLEAAGHARVVNLSTRAAGGLDLSDTQYERRRYRHVAAYRASKQASRMLTWALAADLDGRGVTVNAVNPGYVLSPLTTNVKGLLKLLVTLTRFRAQSPRDGADTAVWAAVAPELDGVTGRFFDKRREIRCRFRDPAAIEQLRELVEQQRAGAERFDAGGHESDRPLNRPTDAADEGSVRQRGQPEG
jgi:NAD(P)-dependent dehydrogenase (short-subunit alcohol dehydrogenase family)